IVQSVKALDCSINPIEAARDEDIRTPIASVFEGAPGQRGGARPRHAGRAFDNLHPYGGGELHPPPCVPWRPAAPGGGLTQRGWAGSETSLAKLSATVSCSRHPTRSVWG